MKAKFTIANDPRLQKLLEAAQQPDIYRSLFAVVLEGQLGVKGARERPAAYFAQMPDTSVVIDPLYLGVVFQLTGISRGEREPKQFHRAYEIAVTQVKGFVQAHTPVGTRVQVFVQFCLDHDVPVTKGQGGYSSILDICEEWIEGTMQVEAAA